MFLNLMGKFLKISSAIHLGALRCPITTSTPFFHILLKDSASYFLGILEHHFIVL